MSRSCCNSIIGTPQPQLVWTLSTSITKICDTLQKYHRQADRDLWVEKFKGRTKSIDGLPTRPTDRFITGEA